MRGEARPRWALQFALAVAAVLGEHAATTSRTLLLAIDEEDVLKIALLASFAAVATTAAARAGAAPGGCGSRQPCSSRCCSWAARH